MKALVSCRRTCILVLEDNERNLWDLDDKGWYRANIISRLATLEKYGGAKVAAQTSQMRDELIRAKEDSVKKDVRILILEEKMRELEDLVRGGAGSNNVSDGASCGMRRP
ncbi:unnamed protein product [Rhodiola kirilowii]